MYLQNLVLLAFSLAVDINVTTANKAHLAAQVGPAVWQSKALIVGKVYKFTYTISGYASGGIEVDNTQFDGAVTTNNVDGTYNYDEENDDLICPMCGSININQI